jgi:hypothetical protein
MSAWALNEWARCLFVRILREAAPQAAGYAPKWEAWSALAAFFV